MDGNRPWILLNNDPVHGEEFVDNNFTVGNRTDIMHYRVLLISDGQEFDSPVTRFDDKLHRGEFGLLRRMVEKEFKELSHTGPRVRIFRLRSWAPNCPACTSNVTGQRIATSVCTTCYGTGKEGGYNPPVDSWMAFTNAVIPIATTDRQDMGSSDKKKGQVRLPGYPLLTREDLIIHRETDNRYVVGVNHPALFKGMFPVNQTLEVSLLARSDVRYKLPIDYKVAGEEAVEG